MAHRLLVIENPSISTQTSLGRMLASEASFRCEHTNWDSFVPDSLRHCTAHLIVAVAVPQPAKAMSLFRWLHDHTVSASIFAVLPSQPENQLFRSAIDAVDDFILWPTCIEEWRHRLTRLLGPEKQEPDSVHCQLTRELGLAQLVGTDPTFVRTIGKIPLIAQSDAHVLITGETGTGKELCARAIHHLSKRRNFPFIPVECGAIPDHLFENEVFGHAQGAFTDAHNDQKGLVAMADRGTLFLDEIDALSPAAQAKVLRFLEECVYKPLGTARFAQADVNVIAATNRNLESCVQKKRFRSDLYFRLNVLHIHMPPLREHPGDIGLLAHHFLGSLSAATGRLRKRFSPNALRRLESYDWPGNVRELFNVVQHAVVFSEGPQILPCHLSLPTWASASEVPATNFRLARAEAISRFERVYVEELLRKHHGNITQAALEAGKDRRAFGRLVKKYSIGRQAL